MPFINEPPLYRAWASMRRRCDNRNFKQFADYGGRGITYCERWESFKNFEEDMSPKPEGTSLDRIDNEKGYSPENCRWATKTEQQRNQRVTRWVEIEGKRYRAVDLADISGRKTDVIVERAAQGLTYDEVISKEKRKSLVGLSLGGKASGAAKKAKTHCPHGHEFTEPNTMLNSQGYRTCRECHNAKMRRLGAAKRALAAEERPPRDVSLTCRRGHPWTAESTRLVATGKSCRICERVAATLRNEAKRALAIQDEGGG